MKKPFKGKAIYNPQGKAGEYAAWACNFYVGCSNGCEYCYCKKGILAKVMGQDKPQLKKCFKDEKHALIIFHEEMRVNSELLQKTGLFFSFTTDPLLPEAIDLTIEAMYKCLNWSIPVKILSKVANENVINRLIDDSVCGIFDESEEEKIHTRQRVRSQIAIGFTLTGHDELEPNASSNAKRIEAMKKLYEAGFRTFASIEPIIDFKSSFDMIKQAVPYCNLFKIGLMSGVKVDEKKLRIFIAKVKTLLYFNHPAKVYWKESIKKVVGSSMLESGFSVDRDYNLFNN